MQGQMQIMSYKLQDKKNPASYLKSIQNVGFEQTSTKFIEIFVA